MWHWLERSDPRGEVDQWTSYQQPWTTVPGPRQKIFYPSHAPDTAVSQHPRLLDSGDGFPWCNVPFEKFSSIGISFKDIDRGEIDRILEQGTTELYPYLDSIESIGFNPLHLMGIYLDDVPTGFACAGLSRRCALAWLGETGEEKSRAEVGLIHIPPRIRGYGIGSLLRTVATLRLLQSSPDTLVSHVSDKTGVINHLIEEIGMKYVGINRRHLDPEYQRELVTKEERDAVQTTLTKRVEENLGAIRRNKALIKRLQFPQKDPK